MKTNNCIATIFLASLAAAAPTLGKRYNQLCDKFGYDKTDDFAVNNNIWGSHQGSQCTQITDDDGSGSISWESSWTWSAENAKGDSNEPASYPYSQANAIPQNAQLSSITKLSTNFEW